MVFKELLAELDQLGNLRSIISAYEEIAASYMRRIRNNVVQKREFLDGLSVIFSQVKNSYKAEIEVLLAQKKKTSKDLKTSVRPKNGKTVLVLLSANTGLYGSIVKQTYDLFINEVKKGQSDVAIIGRLGNLFFKNESIKTSVSYFDFPDNTVDQNALRDIVEFLINYEKIVVFYGEFQNVVTQKPTASSISGDSKPTTAQQQTAPVPGIKYIFEPSLVEILSFFEGEILASIFEQTMYESQLAKFASRMITLDQALENIKNNMSKSNFQYQQIKHRNQNAKQLNSLSGVSLWKR